MDGHWFTGVQMMGSGFETPEPVISFHLNPRNRRLGENGKLPGESVHKFDQIR